MNQTETITRFPNIMISSFQRKIYNSNKLNKTPLTIDKHLLLGNEDYQLRSIVFHQGTDETVYGHYVCHYLVECKLVFNDKSNGKQYEQWFLFDDKESEPITAKVAVEHEQVKRDAHFCFMKKEQTKS